MRKYAKGYRGNAIYRGKKRYKYYRDAANAKAYRRRMFHPKSRGKMR